MAQAEDTELRDLVIEALERNGSLAKIRALLRANIFLAFDDGCENMKQNVNLDNILKQPEGVLALSIIHEFLEYCCLKNTLFVYISESRQGNDYNYEGRKALNNKLKFSSSDSVKEPVLLTLVKNMQQHNKKCFELNSSDIKNRDKHDEKNYGDDQNCTYILHEDSQSSTTSNSNSDNSSDEKNKLQLRLQLDNSDTDTSSDSAKGKSSSEYIPGDHILESNNMSHNVVSLKSTDLVDVRSQNDLNSYVKSDKRQRSNEIKMINSNSDSTSYIDIKPYDSLEGKMFNTSGLPIVNIDAKNPINSQDLSEINIQSNLATPKSPKTLSSLSPISNKKHENSVGNNIKLSQGSYKSDDETSDFSYGDDFSSSPISKFRDSGDQLKVGDIQSSLEKAYNEKSSSVGSPHQASQSSRSSVSLSEVTDLLSEKSSLIKANKSLQSHSISNDKSNVKPSKLFSEDSAVSTESVIPSLSNLSLEIHSD